MTYKQRELRSDDRWNLQMIMDSFQSSNEFELPNYHRFVTDVSYALFKSWKQLKSSDLQPSSWYHTLTTQGSCTLMDLFGILFFAVAWTLLRSLMTACVFKEIARFSRLAKREEKNLPESLWKLSFCLVAWFSSAYLVLYKYKLFFNPLRTVTDWKLHSEVPWDIYAVYMLQISYYSHSIYATLVLDEWRKDSIVLIIHHVVSIILIANSYLFRYIHLGILVLFLHDLSDVFLESTKISVYYKSKGGKWASICDTLSSVGFILFGISWFVFRLYWYPLKVIYVAAYVSKSYYEEVPPFYFFTVGLLLILLALHIYWFKFILVMAYKVLTGTAKEVKDEREYQNGGVNKRNGSHASNGWRTKRD